MLWQLQLADGRPAAVITAGYTSKHDVAGLTADDLKDLGFLPGDAKRMATYLGSRPRDPSPAMPGLSMLDHCQLLLVNNTQLMLVLMLLWVLLLLKPKSNSSMDLRRIPALPLGAQAAGIYHPEVPHCAFLAFMASSSGHVPL